MLLEVLEVSNNTSFFHYLVLIIISLEGSLACLILPAAIYLKVMPPESDMYLKAKILFAFGVLVMLLVIIFTIIDLAS